MATDWQRSLVTLTATVVTAAIVFVMYWASSIFIPIALAIFLAFVLSPVVTRLERRGLGRMPAVIATVGMLLLLFVGMGALVTKQVAQLADTLPDRREAIKSKLLEARAALVGDGGNRFAQLTDEVMDIMLPDRANSKPKPGEEKVVVEAASPPLTTQFATYFNPAIEVVGQAAFAFILTVFMLLKREDLRNRAIQLLGGGKVTTTTRAVDDASRRISRYLLSQLMVNTVFGLIIAAGLFTLGLDYAILWGFIATVMRYVPYIGTWIGLIPPVLFSFATAPDWGHGWGQPIAVLALFIGLEALCNNLVEPYLYGRSMGLSEVAQLIAAALWGFLWGPIGLILSGPLTVCLLVLGRHVTRFKYLVVLLGDQPPMLPRVVFYQRLAARDQDEAEEIALEEAKKSKPEDVFDEVILPALCLARHDAAGGDLDEAELRFVVRGASEIAEEVRELHPRPDSNHDASERLNRVLVCPARDDAERVAGELLALTLNPARWEARVAGAEMLASELLALVREFQPEVVVIAALPPNGLSHSRYLITRLRRHFPELKILLGRWGCEDRNGAALTQTIGTVDGIDRRIADTRKRLTELRPLLLAQKKEKLNAEENTEVVGTVSA